MIRFACPQCRAAMKAEDAAAGFPLVCPQCGQACRVPAGSEPAPRPARRPSPPPPLAPVNGGKGQTADAYFLKDQQGKITGPFAWGQLQRLAQHGKLQPSWQVSPDGTAWGRAAKLPGLFTEVESALAAHVPTAGRYRGLTRTEMVGLFLDKFVLNNEQFSDFFPWFTTVRACWARITLPSNFIITEVTANGARHVRYDFRSGESTEISQPEVDSEVKAGVRQTDALFIGFVLLLGLAWLAWLVMDFSLASFSWKTFLMGALSLAGFIYKTKRSKVFVGYELDEAAKGKLQQVAAAFRTLRQSRKVWMFVVEEHGGAMDWKYNAGNLFSVAKLPAAIFNRPIPHIETNIRVVGITFEEVAVYFLPEKILVIDGPQIGFLNYSALGVGSDQLEYVEPDGRVFEDSCIIGQRWKHINKDGSRDKRFKANHELPVVRCGVVAIDVGRTRVQLLTSNPATPPRFQQTLLAVTSAGTDAE